MRSLNDKVIRVLVVEDSPVASDLIVHLLNADPCLQVVGVAIDGELAVEAAQRLLPDVITMDIHLPKMSGFTATRKIMETCPTRIVMVTSNSAPCEIASTFCALEAGALTVLEKPLGPHHPAYQAAAEELVRTVKLMAEIQVVKRWARAPRVERQTSVEHFRENGLQTEIKLVAIGASTGGPPVLQRILSNLPQGFAVPILIVQHIATGFSIGFAEWLSRASGYPVRIAKDGEYAQAGVAYLAPDEMQMKVSASGAIALLPDPPENSLRPSVSYLFRSVATAFGPYAIGVLLTGMGRDGAKELKEIRETGAVTIAQDKETSVVNGMPGEAVKLDAATYVLAPDSIAAMLVRLVPNRNV